MTKQPPTYKVGDLVEATCGMGRWVAKVVSVNPRRGAAAKHTGPMDDGYAYETLGLFVSGWAVDRKGGKLARKLTLRQLWSTHLMKQQEGNR